MRTRDRILTPTGALRLGPSLLLSVLGIALALGFTIAYVARVDQRRVRSAQVAQQAQREQGEQTRAVVCRLIVAQVDAYAEQPPQTAAGRNIAETWAVLKLQLGC